MQAILKERHQQFCKGIKEVCISRSLSVHEVAEMEAELYAVFQNYQDRLNEVRELIIEYQIKQKLIRQKVKMLIKKDAKKTVVENFKSAI